MKYRLFVDASVDTTMRTYVGGVGIYLETLEGSNETHLKVPSVIVDANDAEIWGAYAAVKWLFRNFPVNRDDKIVLYTDSDHVERNWAASSAKKLLNNNGVSYTLKILKGHKQHDPIHLAQSRAHRLALKRMRQERDQILKTRN